jgi:Carbohydrate family 9 binding domain-like
MALTDEPPRWLGAVALSCVLLTACVGSSADSHDARLSSTRLKAFILGALPNDIGQPVGADFSGKLKLVGARVDPSSIVRPGDRVKLTLYWQVQQKLDAGWSLFTHVVDASGERVLNIDNVGPLREVHGASQALPPSDWEAGKVYVDEQMFVLPASIKTDKIQILTGIWKGDDRLKITAGPHDSTDRAIAATLSVNLHAAPAKNRSIPSLSVEKLDPSVKIKLDGKLDEPAWQSAPSTGPLIDVRTGDPNQAFPVNGDAKVLWNDEGIYVGFSIADTDMIGGFKKGEKDPHLWTRDTVEMMVDPDGDGDNKDYYEIQINPQNLVFDSQFDDYNQPKTEPNGPYGHQEWSSNLKSAVALDGTVDKSDDEDRGYTVEALIPWKSFSKAAKLPPEIGSSWRVNFYAMKNNSGVSWSPILGQGNFHKASRFGRIIWTEKGAATPVAPGSAAPGSATPGSATPAASSSAPPPSSAVHGAPFKLVPAKPALVSGTPHPVLPPPAPASSP